MYLDSIYAIRFYEFCKEFERFRTFEFEVEELKEKFGLTDRYKNYFDFKLKVINQARTELIKNSELYFDFEEIKVGKKVTRLKFFIYKNSKNNDLKDDTLNQEEIEEITVLVKDYVREKVVLSWFKKYPYQQIKEGVLYSIKEYNRGVVKEIGKYLQKMVAVPNIIDTGEEKKQVIQKKKKQQADLQEVERQILAIDRLKDDLKKTYFQKRIDFVNQTFTTNGQIIKTIMKQLQADVVSDKPTFLAELALNSFKGDKNSKKDFMQNFSEGATFQAYSLDFMSKQFPAEFDKIKMDFLPLANKLGMTIDDLV